MRVMKGQLQKENITFWHECLCCFIKEDHITVFPYWSVVFLLWVCCFLCQLAWSDAVFILSCNWNMMYYSIIIILEIYSKCANLKTFCFRIQADITTTLLWVCSLPFIFLEDSDIQMAHCYLMIHMRHDMWADRDGHELLPKEVWFALGTISVLVLDVALKYCIMYNSCW